jgi:hypothetical protein
VRSRPAFITWLWQPRGGWREGAAYTPEIIAGVQHMLIHAVPGHRHICVSDPIFHDELERRGVEPWPIWDVHGRDRTSRHGFDCYARLGLWGGPGEAMARVLGLDIVQWIDADVMIRRTAGPILLEDWDDKPEMFWIPRNALDMGSTCKFGSNVNTWLGVNGSLCRLRLGSRPAWWNALKSEAWVAETEAKICGSDQAAITRLLLEEIGEDWETGNPAIFRAPHFSGQVVPWGMGAAGEVEFFPYDLDTNYTKPWLSDNAYLRREWRVLAGLATDAEQRAECHPGLRRYMGKR